jgi:Protein of unknown function (DUF3180)
VADRRPTVVPTSARAVVLAALVGAGVSWLGLQVVRYAGAALPLPGMGAWASVLLLTAATGWLAWRTRDAVRRREHIDVAVSVTRLRIGKAGALGGAALGGAYLAFSVVAFGGWPAPLAQSRVLDALVALIACVGWGISGLALERACRIPGDPDERGADLH